MTRFGTICAVAILAATLSSTIQAAGWAWMRGSAVSEFTDLDWETFKTQAANALTEHEDGEQLDWLNADSGSGGSIKPLSTFTFNDQHCRRIAFRNFTRKGLKGGGVYNLCLQPSGEWMFVTDSEINAQTPAAPPLP